jgi:hypothetical protein
VPRRFDCVSRKALNFILIRYAMLIIDGHDQRGLFRKQDELDGANEAPLRILPADQPYLGKSLPFTGPCGDAGSRLQFARSVGVAMCCDSALTRACRDRIALHPVTKSVKRLPRSQRHWKMAMRMAPITGASLSCNTSFLCLFFGPSVSPAQAMCKSRATEFQSRVIAVRSARNLVIQKR